jgi:predicted pyridoxine 5'-phosphate oxidase superfamily flavin-nucleotide-binding protein
VSDLEDTFVTSVEGLAAHYTKPAERILKLELDYVNDTGRAFIAASPFLVLATGSHDGLDCSPKGDKPGSVKVSKDWSNAPYS